MIRDFFDTTGFLTRLAPARVISDEAMNRCMRYMPYVGALLGAVIAAPFNLGLFQASPWVQAWLMVALSVFLTRGLHFDGLGDVCDAVTTHTDPDRFWEVVKDSRAGAFGVIGLVMALGGQIILFREMAMRDAFGVVVWTFIMGRAGGVWLGYHVRHLTRPGLGKLYIDGATLGVALATTAVTFLAGLYLAGWQTTLAATAIVTIMLFALYRLAEKVGGANGDFLGCGILLSEIAVGLGFVLTL